MTLGTLAAALRKCAGTHPDTNGVTIPRPYSGDRVQGVAFLVHGANGDSYFVSIVPYKA